MLTPYFSVTRSLQTTPSKSSMKPPSGAARAAPSGIAQLRRSIDHQGQTHQADSMNLDDFILPSSVGSPAGLSPSPSNERTGPSNATAPAIPIRKPNHPQELSLHLQLAHASAPSVPPTITRENEFGYIQRHVRKTSIDERRVSCKRCTTTSSLSLLMALSASQETSRSLSTGASGPEHHDTKRSRCRDLSPPLLSRSADAIQLPAPDLAAAGPLLHRHLPTSQRPGSDNKLGRSFPTQLWIFSSRFAAHGPE